MPTDGAAIQVTVLRDSEAPDRFAEDRKIAITEIASLADATTTESQVRSGRARCRITLRDRPSLPEPWVFRYDDDEETRPRELLVAETLQQVTGLMNMATRENRCVTVSDMGNAAAEAVRATRVSIKPMDTIHFPQRAEFPPKSKRGSTDAT